MCLLLNQIEYLIFVLQNAIIIDYWPIRFRNIVGMSATTRAQQQNRETLAHCRSGDPFLTDCKDSSSKSCIGRVVKKSLEFNIYRIGEAIQFAQMPICRTPPE